MTHPPGYEQRRYAAKLFSRIVHRYDLMNAIMSLGLIRGWRLHAASTVAGGPGGPVLDVASGTGDLALALARRGRRVVGLDLLPGMALRARSKVRPPDTHETEFVVGDALSLPFPSGIFAAVATAFGLRNLPDISAGLAEMVRVLRPGGRLVVLEMVPPQRGTGLAKRVVRFHLRHIVPFLGVLLAWDRESYVYLNRSSERFPPPERLASLMEDAGLVDISFRLLGLGSVAVHRGTKPA